MTLEELVEKFEDADWEEIEVVCPDGAALYIKPCSMSSKINSLKECEYFLVEGDMPWLSNSSIDKILENINNHAELVVEADNEKLELQEYYDEYSKLGWPEDTFSMYSDWHKDCYGFRPSRHSEPGIYIHPSER